MNEKWEALHRAAMEAVAPREVSRLVEAGGVAAAVESVSGKIYVGVCVDTACTLGICAERNALFHMLTCGENAVRRVIAVDRDGRAMPPCGACREFIAQLMPDGYRSVEIMLDCDTERVVTLGDLTPDWWI